MKKRGTSPGRGPIHAEEREMRSAERFNWLWTIFAFLGSVLQTPGRENQPNKGSGQAGNSQVDQEDT